MPIVWTDAKGRCCITQLTDEYLARERKPGETTDDAVLRLAREVQKKMPLLKDATPKLMKSADMPVDRVNRDAWKSTNGAINTASK